MKINKKEFEQIKIKLQKMEADHLVLQDMVYSLGGEVERVKSGVFGKVICHELHVIDGSGVARISAQVCPHGTAELALRDSSSETRIASRTFEDGEVSFGICDANGTDRVVIADYSDKFTGLTLFDPCGKERLSCVTFDDGYFMCQILDTDEIPRMHASTTANGNAKITLNTTESGEM